MSDASPRPQIASLNPRSVFRPTAAPPGKLSWQRFPSTRALLETLVSYYRDPLSWAALVVTSIMLCYVGGGAMFWFHAEYLGEGGPAIPWQTHWLLDSTVGFVALTPALAVLLPLATWAATHTVGRLQPSALPLSFAVLVGTAFSLLTIPGPIAHDLLVGRGTWLADQVTRWVGEPAAPAATHAHYGWLADLTQQLGFGLPLYVALTVLSVVMLRMTGLRRRARGNL